MEYLEAAPKLLFTDKCIKEYFDDFNFLDGKFNNK